MPARPASSTFFRPTAPPPLISSLFALSPPQTRPAGDRPECRVQPHAVGEDFDVLEDLRPSFRPRRERLAAAELVFQRTKERFRRCIIPAISFTAHALLQAVAPKFAANRLAGILRTSIRVKDHPTGPSAAHQRHHERLHDHAGLHRTAHRPPDDLPRV